MRRSTFEARSTKTIAPALAGFTAALAVLAPARQSHATFHVPHTQAAVRIDETNNNDQCSLFEAIDAINNGKTAPGAFLHGCTNDEWGGPFIEVEADIDPKSTDPTKRFKYKTFGAVMNTYMEIYAYTNSNVTTLEHSGPSAVLTNNGGTTSLPTAVSGFVIQHTGANPGRVITNTGNLYLSGVTIQNGDVTANTGTAAYGGGIYNSGNGGVELADVSVYNNKAKRGGGIYTTTVQGVGLEIASVTNNFASEIGGGMYTTGRLNVFTATVSDNTATGNGGGVYCEHGNNSYCAFHFATIANNKAPKGGGVFRVSSVGHACNNTGTCNKSSLFSSIVSGNKNSSGGTGEDYNGDPHWTQPGGGFPENKSLFSNFTGNTNKAFDFTGSAGLGSLINAFGNVTKTRSISSSSAAKDAAKNGSMPAFCPEQDQNYNFRPSGPTCDLGAYELQQ
jgi:predicted outer membrane repeat protein